MKLNDIFESPYINDTELPYKVLSKITKSALNRSYTLLARTSVKVEEMELDVFSSNISGFVAGFVEDNGNLDLMVNVSCRPIAYPIEPSKLSSNYQQVSMVNVSKEFADRGFTKQIYNIIVSNVDLVSDHEQYLRAKGLWKSLVRDSDVNVYVFDGRIKDYVKDDSGNVKKYNGKNINDEDIWGTKEEYRSVLLVATTKNL